MMDEPWPLLRDLSTALLLLLLAGVALAPWATPAPPTGLRASQPVDPSADHGSVPSLRPGASANSPAITSAPLNSPVMARA
jgi:hypothetical protein